MLYHGTATWFLDAIMAEGLRPGQRHHVHLSNNVHTAASVGQRDGVPVVLQVEAGRMHRDGMRFFQADNGVWLTAHVPATFLIRPR
ncbi:RNA 2'-phosphotransferase [Xanthomonas bromi]|uniref:RNA 2'-phosphotransferase n=1 Tax=Xanthomonas bromi TaxID=56449 RepID=A0A1C3NQV7_9XANT|nr:RNA 2'-phosphotransferase [Xanthomonas bromi]